MFVDVVRRYLETLPADRTGWLAGLREPFVGRALTALHRSPAHQWTLESLAREVGLSRSALAERFTQFVGHPPMQYLANWRMQLAANFLQSGTDNVTQIAERVGYESEAAFSRAFKKTVGVPPSQWRKRGSANGWRKRSGPWFVVPGAWSVLRQIVDATKAQAGARANGCSRSSSETNAAGVRTARRHRFRVAMISRAGVRSPVRLMRLGAFRNRTSKPSSRYSVSTRVGRLIHQHDRAGMRREPSPRSAA